MKIGVSSSCFYPQETEKSFRMIAEMGIKTTEIFFNARSELGGEILDEILQIKKEYDVDIVSVHPFASFAEGFFIFSEYERRHLDSLEDYKRFFEAENKLGAKIHVVHGCKKGVPVPKERYARQYYDLVKVGKEMGIKVCHENVVNYHPETPEFMRYLADCLGDDFHMVLDIKQARRANQDPYKFIELVGNHIEHLHLSDYTYKSDCTIPDGSGRFDFRKLFDKMDELNYTGAALLEVYRSGFKKAEELAKGREWLERKYNEK